MIMMVIRKEQFATLEELALGDFLDRAASFLRQHHASSTRHLRPEALRDLVQSCVARAKPFGLETEREVICFAVVSLLLGPDFLDNPAHLWARELLERKVWSAEKRARDLLETGSLVHQRTLMRC
jgi:hypothetical protein